MFTDLGAVILGFGVWFLTWAHFKNKEKKEEKRVFCKNCGVDLSNVYVIWRQSGGYERLYENPKTDDKIKTVYCPNCGKPVKTKKLRW